MSEAITLKGFFLILRCPTEEGLHVTIDASMLPPATFISLIHRLQDELRDIDEFYAEDADRLRGRSVRALHRRLFHVDERHRILRFSPFPSRYLNQLKIVRRYLYEAVHRHAIVIQSESRRNIYLLPEEMAEVFLREVEKLNGILERVEGSVKAFTHTRIFDSISDILEGVGLPELPRVFHVGRIQAQLLPVSVEPGAIEEWAERSPRVAYAVRQAQEELVSRAVEDLRRKLEPLVKRLVAQRRLEKIAEELRRLEGLATQLGLSSIARTVIAPLRGLAEMDPQELRRIPGGLEARVESLFRRL